jgi:hypothetical protein
MLFENKLTCDIPKSNNTKPIVRFDIIDGKPVPIFEK